MSDITKEFEGCRLKAYKCPAGVWTIGWGHTSEIGAPHVTPNMVITQKRADEILDADLAVCTEVVDRLVKVHLTPNQQEALADFVFNVGESQFASSTLLKRVNAKRFADVPAELMKWTRGGGRVLPGLVKRRQATAILWRGIDAKHPLDIQESRARPDTPPKPKPITKSREANTSALVGAAAVATAVSEGASQLKDGADLLPILTESLGRPTVLVLLAIGVACAAIWYWRKQRLDEEGA